MLLTGKQIECNNAFNNLYNTNINQDLEVDENDYDSDKTPEYIQPLLLNSLKSKQS